MYKNFTKRFLDFILSMCAIIALLPFYIILIVLGCIIMKGNPFFIQERPGMNEKGVKLIKFRTMNNEKDVNGNLLPDEVRLNEYGKLLRFTSLDELPELFNILVGDMAIVGPRPLLTEYIPYYTDEEHHRHDVRPGLTGLAQINGRNAISSWEDRFTYDIRYVNSYNFLLDAKIIIMTVVKVMKRSDILVGKQISAGRLDVARKNRRAVKGELCKYSKV